MPLTAYTDPFDAEWEPLSPSDEEEEKERPVRAAINVKTSTPDDGLFEGDWEPVSAPRERISGPRELQKPTTAQWREAMHAPLPPSEHIQRQDITQASGLSLSPEGIEAGKYMVELAKLQKDRMFGDISQEILQRISEIKASMPDRKALEEKGILEEALFYASELAPQIFETAIGAAKGAAKYGAVGMAAGVAAGAPAGLPGMAAGGLAGTAMGAGFGAKLGAAKTAFTLEAGLAFDELLDMTDENGEKIDPELARAAAIGVGGINAAIEMFQINTLLKFMPGGKKILELIRGKALKEALANKTVGELLKKTSKAYGKMVGTEVLQEISQEATNIFAEETVKAVENQLNDKNFKQLIESSPDGEAKINYEMAKEHWDRVKGIAWQTGLGIGLIGGVGGGVNVATGMQQIRKDKAGKEGGDPLVGVDADKKPDTSQTKKLVDLVRKGEATIDDLRKLQTETPKDTPTYEAVSKAIDQIGKDSLEDKEIDILTEQPVDRGAKDTKKPSQEDAVQKDKEAQAAEIRNTLLRSADEFEERVRARQEEINAQNAAVQAQADQQVLAQREIIVPATPERVPIESNIVPAATKSVPVATKSVPVESKSVPVESKSVPRSAAIETEIEHPSAIVKEDEIFQGFDEPTPLSSVIEKAAKEAETEPSEAKKEAGNFQKGHINLFGMDISIENPKGSIRSGTDRDGKQWKTKMAHHYGYIRRTKDNTDEQIDVFIGPNPSSQQAYVIEQVDPKTGKFDEYKTMLGFSTPEQAIEGYLDNYEPGWNGFGNISVKSIDEFKEWTKTANLKPAKDQVKIIPFVPETKGNPENASNFRQFIAMTGGVNPDDPDHKGHFNDIKFKLKKVRTKSGNVILRKVPAKFPVKFFQKNARGLDEKVLQAIEWGWLPEGSDEQDYLDAIDRNPTMKWKDMAEGVGDEDLEQKMIDQEMEARYGTSDIEELKRRGIIKTEDIDGTIKEDEEAFKEDQNLSEEEWRVLLEAVDREGHWLFGGEAITEETEQGQGKGEGEIIEPGAKEEPKQTKEEMLAAISDFFKGDKKPGKPDLQTAYASLVKEKGYSSIEIADLRDRMGVSQEVIDRILREEAGKGNAELSGGDWNLSSDHVKSGAIELVPGKKDTLVKFKGKEADKSDLDRVPKGFYFDGSTIGGVVKRTASEIWATIKTERGTWAIEHKRNDAKWPKYSKEEFEKPIDAAIALKNGEVNFTRGWLSEEADIIKSKGKEVIPSGKETEGKAETETLLKKEAERVKPLPKGKALSDLLVKTTAVRETTGEKVQVESNAQEAMDYVNNRIKTFQSMLECLAS